LILIGGYEKKTYNSFLKDIKILDPFGEYIHYLGEQTQDDVKKQYNLADLFVFPSTCENMPNILIEAMSSALPIVCSNSSPMPEFLKDSGIYFIPGCKYDLERTILDVLKNAELRKNLSQRALEYSEDYRWEKCVLETITFVRNI
jgi:glycosyltransferase involved in cell wall biosynthesis